MGYQGLGRGVEAFGFLVGGARTSGVDRHVVFQLEVTSSVVKLGPNDCQ